MMRGQVPRARCAEKPGNPGGETPKDRKEAIW